MSNWGSGCNYRYEQRIHFYNDGRFRVVSGAFGKGCGTIGVYRPVVRIDIAVDGSGNNSFATWDGAEWQTHQEEFWQLQDVSPTRPRATAGWSTTRAAPPFTLSRVRASSPAVLNQTMPIFTSPCTGQRKGITTCRPLVLLQRRPPAGAA
jgi:hypothetical protein